VRTTGGLHAYLRKKERNKERKKERNTYSYAVSLLTNGRTDIIYFVSVNFRIDLKEVYSINI